MDKNSNIGGRKSGVEKIKFNLCDGMERLVVKYMIKRRKTKPNDPKMLPVQILGAILVNNDENQQEIHQYNIERGFMRGESDPFLLRDTQFIDLFRLTKDMVHYLCVTIVPHMSQTTHPSAVDPTLRIFSSLYFYATGSYQRTIGQTFQLSMAQNTVSKCIDEVTDLIVDHLTEEWIKFPRNFNDKLKIKRQFMEKYHFPGCIGAIDCTHIAIVAPAEEEHNYLNRKGFHSKNVQIICDANLKILNVNARWGGATHDAFIWRQST
ncbi:putative nuclease HARBI1 [Sitophilus oryzae]|uniref:Putative nuclease HARBI1 n=1 Tax=Sitophilus oryzae TaxID=7048 RepID=A0A6J2YNJ1_SITOR|nr:putative nuclease HARBI1 [Sitophilus oryzae]